MTETTITVKGQVTIPKEIRDNLNLSNGDKVAFVFDGDRAVLFPVKGDILSLRGALKNQTKKHKFNLKAARQSAKKHLAENYLKKFSR